MMSIVAIQPFVGHVLVTAIIIETMTIEYAASMSLCEFEEQLQEKWMKSTTVPDYSQVEGATGIMGSTVAEPSSSTAVSLIISQASTSVYSEELSSTMVPCPENMVYANCACHVTCGDPYSCFNYCVTTKDCVCPTGYVMKGDDCVHIEECNCYMSEVGRVLTSSDDAVLIHNCGTRCFCLNDELICDSHQCGVNEQCEEEEENGVGNCKCKYGFIEDGGTCRYPIDCDELFTSGFSDCSPCQILPLDWYGQPFDVSCDIGDGGGWTVFQRREDGSEDFYRDWDTYKEGFGTLDREFWLGNEKIFYLTNQANYQLRIDLVNRYGNPYYAKYDRFRISGENDKYRLVELGEYSGNADDTDTGIALSYHVGMAFTTKDRDNDASSNVNCAQYKLGAWWYKACYRSNLNGKYYPPSTSEGVTWYNLPQSQSLVKFTEMKIRPV